jgi:hypothetical protein
LYQIRIARLFFPLSTHFVWQRSLHSVLLPAIVNYIDMKTRATFFALVLALLCPCLLAQSAVLDRAEILGRLTQGYSPSYLGQLIKTRGVSFSPSADFLDRVRLAGGDGILIERLSSAMPSAGISQNDRPFEFLAKCAELIHIGAGERAENDCRAAIEENPESPWPLMAAIRAMAYSGAPEQEHVALLRRALSLDSHLVAAHMALATSDVSPEERDRETQAVAAFAQDQPEDFPVPPAFAAYTSDRVNPARESLSVDLQSNAKAQIE